MTCQRSLRIILGPLKASLYKLSFVIPLTSLLQKYKNNFMINQSYHRICAVCAKITNKSLFCSKFHLPHFLWSFQAQL